MEAQAPTATGHVELAKWEPGKCAALRVNLYAIVLFAAASWMLRAFYQRVHARALTVPASRSTWVWICLLVPLAVLAHEVVHALVVKAYGGRPRVHLGIEGGLLPGAYTVMEKPMGKLQFVHMVLAPSVYITGLCLAMIVLWPAAARWFVLAAIINVSGSAGDLELVLAVRSYSRNTFFVDTGDGVCVLQNPARHAAPSMRLRGIDVRALSLYTFNASAPACSALACRFAGSRGPELATGGHAGRKFWDTG
ncbi:MAG: DUF3267 domain-containing protein [Bacillota bacterium]